MRPITLALALPLALTPNPKSTEELTRVAQSDRRPSEPFSRWLERSQAGEAESTQSTREKLPKAPSVGRRWSPSERAPIGCHRRRRQKSLNWRGL